MMFILTTGGDGGETEVIAVSRDVGKLKTRAARELERNTVAWEQSPYNENTWYVNHVRDYDLTVWYQITPVEELV